MGSYISEAKLVLLLHKLRWEARACRYVRAWHVLSCCIDEKNKDDMF